MTYIAFPCDLYWSTRRPILLTPPSYIVPPPYVRPSRAKLHRVKQAQQSLTLPHRRTIGYILCGRAHPIRVNKITYRKAI